jgi:uncharacterized protein YllA (UPF0747 family)
VKKLANPNELYEEVAKDPLNSIDFWGNVPETYGEAVSQAINKFKPNKLMDTAEGQEKIKHLKDFLIKYHKDMKIYTKKVEANIQLLEYGSVLMGQQPILFGGPGFIANKLGCLTALDTMFRDEGRPLAPVFFIGDYDSLQKELARQYFPNPISNHAFILDSEDYLPEESSIAAHRAELPPYEWLEDYLSKLESNLRGFIKQVKGDKKKVLKERYDHLVSLIKSSFNNSKTLSEWSVSLWGFIANIIADKGIVFVPTSHPVIRKLVAENFYPFIEKRKNYTAKFQEMIDKVTEMGYNPTLPRRHDDYAPFMIECEHDGNRITTTLQEVNDRIIAQGECPGCGHNCSIDVTTKENLIENATRLGPRVDTSQAIFQDLLNIQLRISGPGEVAYYTLVAPSVRAIGYDLPIFIRYTRAFYNTPWIEKLGKQLHQRNQGSIQQDILFTILRKRVDGEKDNDKTKIIEAEEDMKKFILSQKEKLLSNNSNSSDISKYLGWQYGRFTKEKNAQETSWIWFDLALQTGMTDYVDTYARLYTKHSRVGGMYYINTLI